MIYLTASTPLTGGEVHYRQRRGLQTSLRWSTSVDLHLSRDYVRRPTVAETGDLALGQGLSFPKIGRDQTPPSRANCCLVKESDDLAVGQGHRREWDRPETGLKIRLVQGSGAQRSPKGGASSA
ncbi:hypothetical protein NicSoilB8_34580 [Arthrobacter sp. NicSoilB8]|nr:hypothetical protein NicSoilB8_34580 [Arthrobacter sp. NicSoilB8]